MAAAAGGGGGDGDGRKSGGGGSCRRAGELQSRPDPEPAERNHMVKMHMLNIIVYVF
jgi:hypothetical protein